MKLFFNGYAIREPIVAYIDNDVIKRKVFSDGYVYEEKAVSIKQIKDIINGLGKLGYSVEKITIRCNYADFDTKYYRGFPEDTLNKLWRKTGYYNNQEIIVYIERNRLYTIVDGFKILLPKEMIYDYDHKTLYVQFYVKESD